MAIFKITPTTSRLVTGPFVAAFEPSVDDSPSADTLIIDPGAFLIAINFGALLAATGAWTVTVNGSIVSGGQAGIRLIEGNPAVSTIKIGVDGEVQGTNGISLGSSANIVNAGHISSPGNVAIGIFDGGTNTITNSGTISGGGASILDSGDGITVVRNSGQIIGDVALQGGNDTLTNSGTITFTVELGDGTDRLTNSGNIFGPVFSSSGSDTVTNFAFVGDVMKSGIITGTINLGDGNDTFTGGANFETVQDGNGADIVSLGGGNDTYIATGNTGTDGIDTVRGGAGVDTYNASAATNDVNINLDSVAHVSPFSPGAALVAANTATGTNISGTTKDTIFGFENANGGAGNDVIHGSVAINTLLGGAGADLLVGFGGNDKLDGGVGFDVLVGGAGKDQLTGGLDSDLFAYIALSDSGITAATRDVITDFQQGVDKISLFLIDANKTNAAGTDDAFTFVGTNIPTGFSGSPGELHAYWTATGQIVEGDVNGDKKADFSIELQDPLHAITLTSGDFFL